MRHPVLAGLAMLVMVPALWGLEDKKDKGKPDEAQTPPQEFNALVSDYQKEQNDYRTALQAAKTVPERQKIIQEKAPKLAPYAAKMLALAQKNPTDQVALDALQWVVTHNSPNADQALDLLTRHAADPRIGGVCQALAHSASPKAEELLKAVMHKNTSEKVQVTAGLVLSQSLLFRAAYTVPGNDKERERLSEEAEKLLAKTIAKHPDDQQLVAIAELMGNSRLPAAPKVLQLILDKAKLADAQAYACLGLAGHLKQESEHAGDPAKAGELSKQAEALYERIGKEFANVNAAAERAKGELNEMRHLGIGKEAPQIAAEDTNGKPFKLSDYRGKVVLLDFWGNW
jgi:AhpC/TSA family